MLVRLLAALAAGLALCAPALAADPPKKADPAEAIIDALFKDVELGDANVNDTPLFELTQRLTKKHAVTLVIDEEAFKAAGENEIRERKPNVAATQLRGLTLHQFLVLTLDTMNATYLVKGNTVQIVPIAHAAKVAKAATVESESGPPALAHPLVSIVFKEKPLNEAAALLAERYDLNVVVSPQAGDARTGFVTARLLNVPADRALDLLAVQSDLRVVRKGNAFLVTSRDHANELFHEKVEKERVKIETEKLREAPPPKPQPEPKP